MVYGMRDYIFGNNRIANETGYYINVADRDERNRSDEEEIRALNERTKVPFRSKYKMVLTDKPTWHYRVQGGGPKGEQRSNGERKNEIPLL